MLPTFLIISEPSLANVRVENDGETSTLQGKHIGHITETPARKYFKQCRNMSLNEVQ